MDQDQKSSPPTPLPLIVERLQQSQRRTQRMILHRPFTKSGRSPKPENQLITQKFSHRIVQDHKNEGTLKIGQIIQRFAGDLRQTLFSTRPIGISKDLAKKAPSWAKNLEMVLPRPSAGSGPVSASSASTETFKGPSMFSAGMRIEPLQKNLPDTPGPFSSKAASPSPRAPSSKPVRRQPQPGERLFSRVEEVRHHTANIQPPPGIGLPPSAEKEAEKTQQSPLLRVPPLPAPPVPSPSNPIRREISESSDDDIPSGPPPGTRRDDIVTPPPRRPRPNLPGSEPAPPLPVPPPPSPSPGQPSRDFRPTSDSGSSHAAPENQRGADAPSQTAGFAADTSASLRPLTSVVIPRPPSSEKIQPTLQPAPSAPSTKSIEPDQATSAEAPLVSIPPLRASNTPLALPAFAKDRSAPDSLRVNMPFLPKAISSLEKTPGHSPQVLPVRPRPQLPTPPPRPVGRHVRAVLASQATRSIPARPTQLGIRRIPRAIRPSRPALQKSLAISFPTNQPGSSSGPSITPVIRRTIAPEHEMWVNSSLPEKPDGIDTSPSPLGASQPPILPGGKLVSSPQILRAIPVIESNPTSQPAAIQQEPLTAAPITPPSAKAAESSLPSPLTHRTESQPAAPQEPIIRRTPASGSAPEGSIIRSPHEPSGPTLPQVAPPQKSSTAAPPVIPLQTGSTLSGSNAALVRPEGQPAPSLPLPAVQKEAAEAQPFERMHPLPVASQPAGPIIEKRSVQPPIRPENSPAERQDQPLLKASPVSPSPLAESPMLPPVPPSNQPVLRARPLPQSPAPSIIQRIPHDTPTQAVQHSTPNHPLASKESANFFSPTEENHPPIQPSEPGPQKALPGSQASSPLPSMNFPKAAPSSNMTELPARPHAKVEPLSVPAEMPAHLQRIARVEPPAVISRPVIPAAGVTPPPTVVATSGEPPLPAHTEKAASLNDQQIGVDAEITHGPDEKPLVHLTVPQHRATLPPPSPSSSLAPMPESPAFNLPETSSLQSPPGSLQPYTQGSGKNIPITRILRGSSQWIRRSPRRIFPLETHTVLPHPSSPTLKPGQPRSARALLRKPHIQRSSLSNLKPPASITSQPPRPIMPLNPLPGDLFLKSSLGQSAQAVTPTEPIQKQSLPAESSHIGRSETPLIEATTPITGPQKTTTARPSLPIPPSQPRPQAIQRRASAAPPSSPTASPVNPAAESAAFPASPAAAPGLPKAFPPEESHQENAALNLAPQPLVHPSSSPAIHQTLSTPLGQGHSENGLPPSESSISSTPPKTTSISPSISQESPAFRSITGQSNPQEPPQILQAPPVKQAASSKGSIPLPSFPSAPHSHETQSSTGSMPEAIPLAPSAGKATGPAAHATQAAPHQIGSSTSPASLSQQPPSPSFVPPSLLSIKSSRRDNEMPFPVPSFHLIRRASSIIRRSPARPRKAVQPPMSVRMTTKPAIRQAASGSEKPSKQLSQPSGENQLPNPSIHLQAPTSRPETPKMILRHPIMKGAIQKSAAGKNETPVDFAPSPYSESAPEMVLRLPQAVPAATPVIQREENPENTEPERTDSQHDPSKGKQDNENSQPPDLHSLAQQVYPLVKRLLAIEMERHPRR